MRNGSSQLPRRRAGATACRSHLGEHVFLSHVGELPVELPSDVEPLAALQHCSPELPLGEGYYFTKGTVTRNLRSLAPSSAYILPYGLGFRVSRA